MKRKSELTATFEADIQKVWDVVTNNSDTTWRSDLDRVEILSEDSFAEYTKQGNCTQFRITRLTPYSGYAFTMENKLFNGNWQGTFEQTEAGKTKIVFYEELEIKNPLIWLLSFLMMDLKKVQNTYAEDLKKKLER